MTYQEIASFAQSWGILYFGLLFAGALVYALWPRNKRTFDEAARVPLREDEP